MDEGPGKHQNGGTRRTRVPASVSARPWRHRASDANLTSPLHSCLRSATMVMPLPAPLRLPSPTSMPVAASVERHHHPRSPIKKHLQATTCGSDGKRTMPKKVGSPQKLKAAVAQNGGEIAVVTPSTLGDAVAEARGGRLRAATLQAVLGLLDRDDDALQQLLPLLHTMASLPLHMEKTRRQVMAMLQRLQNHDEEVEGNAAIGACESLGASTHVGRSKMAARRPASLRDSGRAKSAVSLEHCKEFLLACANEIHELEEVNPWFDYAEETNSEMAAVLARGSTKPQQQQRQRPGKKTKSTPVKYTGAAFDYESAVGSSSTLHTAVDAFDDEVEDSGASQGSQLSDLLCRTADVERDELSSCYEPRSTLSLVDRVACRRVFRVWRGHSASRASPPVGLEAAVVSRAFAALKHNRAVSKLSRGRKQRAFQSLKSLVKTTPSLTTYEAVQTRKPSTTTSRVVVLMHMHWDLVFLLMIACFVQFFMQ